MKGEAPAIVGGVISLIAAFTKHFVYFLLPAYLPVSGGVRRPLPIAMEESAAAVAAW